MPPNSRGWWRDYFQDHPMIQNKTRRHEAYTSPDTPDKTRCICNACFPLLVREQENIDEQRSRRNTDFRCRTQQEIINDMWAAPADSGSDRRWISSHVNTLLNHLRNCEHVEVNIRQDAATKLKKPLPPAPPPPPHYHYGPIPPSSISPLLTASIPPPYPTSVAPSPPLISPLITPDSGSPIYSYGQLTPALNNVGGSTRASSKQKQARYQPKPWTSETQRQLESRIARITASANMPLSWVENLEVKAFFAEFLPDARLTSRRVLTSRLIPTELNAQRAALVPYITGGEATLQCDGWSGGNYHHYTGFVLTVRKQVVTVGLEDNSAERKTGDNLFNMILEKITFAETELQVYITAFVCDDGGDARKGRRLLGCRRPDLIIIPCSAHQTILIVTDYFKCNAAIFVYSTQADQVITWLRSKTFVLGLLRLIQKRLNPDATPLTVIRAVVTRWTSHFLAYRRLLDLRYPILAMLDQDEKCAESQIITGNAAAKAKAQEMITYLKDDSFWKALAQIKSHLQPFAYATNIAQSDQARLDTVLLVWGLLYNYFDNLPLSNESDRRITETVCNSINRRWEASDQDVFIAAVILNPAHKTRPFARSSWFCVGLVTVLLCRLWRRLFRCPCPDGLTQEIHDYLEQSGPYGHLISYWDDHVKATAKSSTPCDPLYYWQGLSWSGVGVSPLPRLAQRLLSVCPNSASCERLFSLLKRTMTPARSRLTGDNLIRIAELNAHMKQSHRQQNRTAGRLKRQLNPTSQTLNALGLGLSELRLDSPVPLTRQASSSQVTPATIEQVPSLRGKAPAMVEKEREAFVLDSDSSGDSDGEEVGEDPEDTTEEPYQTLADIADSLIKLADEGDIESDTETIVDSDGMSESEDRGPLPTPPDRRGVGSGSRARGAPSSSLPDLPFRLDITEVFNFREMYWADALEKQAEGGLADEMDLCEYPQSDEDDGV